MILTNGFIKYLRKTSSINEKGNPIAENEEESDFMPVNIAGIVNKNLQSDSNNYETQSYNVVTDFVPDIYSDNIILFDKDKEEIGRFQVKSKRINSLFNSFSFTV